MQKNNFLHTPFKSFLFLISCLLILAGIFLWQGGGVISPVEGISIKFFNLQSYVQSFNQTKSDSVKKIIKETSIIESTTDKDTVQAITIDTLKILNAIKPLQTDENFTSRIEYPDNNKGVLKKFFNALSDAKNKSTHILYYGDSQIEEDRFSGFIREKLQTHFGGSGCGWLSFMPVAQWIYPKIIYSDNWIKWHCYAGVGTSEKNRTYGHMAQSFLFNPEQGKGKIQIKCNNTASPKYCRFNKIKLFLGYVKEPLIIHYYNNEEKILNDTLIQNNDALIIKEFPVKSTEQITFEFEGLESPYFYGLSLESYGNGVYVDNIALRGSSGTFFHLIPKEILSDFFDAQNVSLIILQFGGNAMPMIDSEQKAVQYCGYIDYQIKLLKKLSSASILLIGPSDMSINQNGEMLTHPYLETVNNGLKEVALKNNCAYFDMYNAMGGKNSMPVWVQENLAAKDYTHFSPAGAKKIAALIYYSLMKDFMEYAEMGE